MYAQQLNLKLLSIDGNTVVTASRVEKDIEQHAGRAPESHTHGGTRTNNKVAFLEAHTWAGICRARTSLGGCGHARISPPVKETTHCRRGGLAVAVVVVVCTYGLDPDPGRRDRPVAARGLPGRIVSWGVVAWRAGFVASRPSGAPRRGRVGCHLRGRRCRLPTAPIIIYAADFPPAGRHGWTLDDGLAPRAAVDPAGSPPPAGGVAVLCAYYSSARPG